MKGILKEEKTTGCATLEPYLWGLIQEMKFFHTAELTMGVTGEWEDRNPFVWMNIFGGVFLTHSFILVQKYGLLCALFMSISLLLLS